MKNVWVSVIILFLSLDVSGQDVLKLNGEKTPYRFIGIQNVYACQFEVTNQQYKEFLSWILKSKGEKACKEYLPDTSSWYSVSADPRKYIEFYFDHPAYADYPVNSITFEQASAYCEWLTDSINKELKDKRIKKIVARLPTEEEWEMAARAGQEMSVKYPWGTNFIRIQKGKHKGDFQACFGLGEPIKEMGSIDYFVPVRSFKPNPFGLYNMSGNVSEMVQEREICKGGSWYDASDRLAIYNRDSIRGPSPKKGFRVFLEIESYQTKELVRIINAKYLDEGLIHMVPSGRKGEIKTVELFNTEVSNQMFMEFIASIQDAELKKQFLPEDTLWLSETNSLQYLHYTDQFPTHPVVNINKPAMEAFCEWLTNVYNADPERKFKELKFFLPSVKDFQNFASCSQLDLFVWGGPYVQDPEGKYLLNFNPLFDYQMYDKDKLSNDMLYRYSQQDMLKASRGLDGYELTAPVLSFGHKWQCQLFQDKKMFYNVNGNVAEATADSDLVIGGSFASMIGNCVLMTPYNTEFASFQENISLPSPQVGFRFAAEIVFRE
jgi:sulfatase modifying factor 1